jgi:hypothetical protein
MTDTPHIDLGAEVGIAPHEYALIALALAVALGFLFRGLLRRRRGAAPACASCPGCTAATPCKAVDISFPETAPGSRTPSD